MKRKRKKNKRIFKIVILLIIILGFIYFFNDIKSENKILDDNNYRDYLDLSKENLKSNNKILKKYPKEEVIKNYKGYRVCCKIEIPKISLESYVLSDYSIESLNTSLVKFYGSNPNEYGNFCVAGHNFKNKNMFGKLKNLNLRDKIVISDNKVGKIEYEVFSIYKVDKNDTSCLVTRNENIREITLITCTADSEKRIIVKAKEVI